MIEYFNEDCVQGMKQYPDKYFDLAVADPPYGIGYDTQAVKSNGHKSGGCALKSVYHGTGWDDQPPNDEYFEQLFRVSKNQIIWGGNYFKQLPPSRSFICWDKRLEGLTRSFADCEQAWCNSELGVARMFRFCWDGMLQGDMKNKEKRIHPTQKPVALYKWILTNYTKPGYKILDTHVGSGSSLIACYELGFDAVGFEIDKEYYDASLNRLEEVKKQIRFEF